MGAERSEGRCRPMAQVRRRTKTRARSMRREMTDAERRLWARIREQKLGGWRFRRQHPIPPYTVDFACVEAKLAIELDGGQHSGSPGDETRDRKLISSGWHVLRFWNNEAMTNIEGVLATILATLGPKMRILEPASIHVAPVDRKSTRLNSSHTDISRMPSSA